MGKKRDVGHWEKKSELVSIRAFTGHRLTYRMTERKRRWGLEEAKNRGMSASLFMNDLTVHAYERKFGFETIYNDLSHYGGRTCRRLQVLMLARRTVRRFGITSEEAISEMAALLCKGCSTKLLLLKNGAPSAIH